MPRTIGLMSGTSLDGVDAAWLDTDGVEVAAFGPAITVPYDDAMRAELRTILDLAPGLQKDDPRLLAVVERLTDYHVQAVEALGREADVVGFHGQTILHQPHRQRTWQIGDANGLASRLRVPVAYDFRSADVAAGGQGAPLVPVYHAALARSFAKPLAILNIGGVANVTWIGGDGSFLAFDTGPGNGPLDDWVRWHSGQAFDIDGAVARAGRPDPEVLARLLSHPYFSLSGPKSLDRLDFADALTGSGLSRLSAANGAATLVQFTAATVAAAQFPQRPERWLVCGGGRSNPVMMDALRECLGASVEPVEAVGWDGDAIEAQCFGFLSARIMSGLPITYPSTTGVMGPMGGGLVAYPKLLQAKPS